MATQKTSNSQNNKPVVSVEPSSASGFNVNVPFVVNSTCTINGTLKIGSADNTESIQNLLETIINLQKKVVELENRIVALGG